VLGGTTDEDEEGEEGREFGFFHGALNGFDDTGLWGIGRFGVKWKLGGTPRRAFNPEMVEEMFRLRA
jgi:hypothetical protein